VFASGETGLDEMILVSAQDLILRWLLGALAAPGGYCNPLEVALPDPATLPEDLSAESMANGDAAAAGTWDDVPESALPEVSVFEAKELKRQLDEYTA
jgi:hypothetical protein